MYGRQNILRIMIITDVAPNIATLCVICIIRLSPMKPVGAAVIMFAVAVNTMNSTLKNGKPRARLRTIKVKGHNEGKKTFADSKNEQNETGVQNQAEDGVIQIEEIVNKGLDLAEVGVGLGVNIASRLGSIFKDQVFEKLNTTGIVDSVMSNIATGQQDEKVYGDINNQQFEERPPAQNVTEPATTENQQSYYLYNRLTLLPGCKLSLSFSINNDSLISTKKIGITVDKFIGDTHHDELDSSLFSVIPDKTEIAAADFEKFILKATIPADSSADTYRGWINVEEQQTYRIPVVLLISIAQQDSSIQQAKSQQTIA